MKNLDFAIQTQLYKANQYFKSAIESVFVENNGIIKPFSEYCYQPRGGSCYYYSTWALMGLKSGDYRICGTIDVPARPGFKATPDYRHAWVEFQYENEYYIYDSMESLVYPFAVWVESRHPRAITFRMTRAEILDRVLHPAFAYSVDEYIWQLKSTEELPKCFAKKDSGWLSSALSYAHLYHSYDTVKHFIAHNYS